MLHICSVCETVTACQKNDGFPLMCCDCPTHIFMIETGQLCDPIACDQGVFLIVCPVCQFKILINNARARYE